MYGSFTMVGDELADAARRAAEEHGCDIAEVPITAIAAAAGISRSTLLRRLGGTRAALDAAVRRAGIDPGGRPPVRERAIEAAARLIAENGLGSFTLEAVAAAASCSLPSLYAIFESRDGLLNAAFDRYGPVPDLQHLVADPPEQLEDLVAALHRVMVTVFTREPRVLPALIADLLARPDGPASRMFEAEFVPKIIGPLQTLLAPQIEAGRVRALPIPVHINLLGGPLIAQLLFRPGLAHVFGDALPPIDEVVDLLSDAYLRTVATPRSRRSVSKTTSKATPKAEKGP